MRTERHPVFAQPRRITGLGLVLIAALLASACSAAEPA